MQSSLNPRRSTSTMHTQQITGNLLIECFSRVSFLISLTRSSRFCCRFHGGNWFVCSDFRPSSLEKVQELLRLRIYQAYAWGVPLIIMAIAIILDNLPDEVSLRPRFGQKRCGFDGKCCTCVVCSLSAHKCAVLHSKFSPYLIHYIAGVVVIAVAWPLIVSSCM